MKIAFFTDSFYPMKNGIVTALLNMAEPLADRGHHIYIFAPSMGRIDEYQYRGIKVFRIPSIPAGFYEDFRWPMLLHFSCYRILKREKCEIIHFLTPFFTSYIGIKLGRLLNIPVVGTFHTFIAEPQYIGHLFRGVIQTQVETVWDYTLKYYNAADYITAPSSSTMKYLRERGCEVPGEIISNGIDTDIFDNSQCELFKQRHRINHKALLYVGRVSKEKNMNNLLEGFVRAWQKDRELQLVIIGDGPSMSEISYFCRKKGLTRSVLLLGAMDYEELIKSGVYRACRFFVTASLTENQPMTILEAQANGMACIGPRSRGIPDLIEDNVTGKLFEPDNPESLGETIIELLRNPTSIKKMEKNTLKSIKSHRLQEVVHRWEETYKKIQNDYRALRFPVKDYIHFKEMLAYLGTFTLEWERLTIKKASTQEIEA